MLPLNSFNTIKSKDADVEWLKNNCSQCIWENYFKNTVAQLGEYDDYDSIALANLIRPARKLLDNMSVSEKELLEINSDYWSIWAKTELNYLDFSKRLANVKESSIPANMFDACMMEQVPEAAFLDERELALYRLIKKLNKFPKWCNDLPSATKLVTLIFKKNDVNDKTLLDNLPRINKDDFNGFVKSSFRYFLCYKINELLDQISLISRSATIQQLYRCDQEAFDWIIIRFREGEKILPASSLIACSEYVLACINIEKKFINIETYDGVLYMNCIYSDFVSALKYHELPSIPILLEDNTINKDSASLLAMKWLTNLGIDIPSNQEFLFTEVVVLALTSAGEDWNIILRFGTTGGLLKFYENGDRLAETILRLFKSSFKQLKTKVIDDNWSILTINEEYFCIYDFITDGNNFVKKILAAGINNVVYLRGKL